MCKPCLRTPVNHLSGLDTLRGRGRRRRGVVAAPGVVGVGDAGDVVGGQVAAGAVEHVAEVAGVDEEGFVAPHRSCLATGTRGRRGSGWSGRAGRGGRRCSRPGGPGRCSCGSGLRRIGLRTWSRWPGRSRRGHGAPGGAGSAGPRRSWRCPWAGRRSASAGRPAAARRPSRRR